MIPFWKLTPGGNPTILLPSSVIPAEQRVYVAQAVMNTQHIGAEQVGYVSFDSLPTLNMMGGEFCLNATRAFAILLADKELLIRHHDGYRGKILVSGMDKPVNVKVCLPKNDLPYAEVTLDFSDLPVVDYSFPNLEIVKLSGITHIVQRGTIPKQDDLMSFCSTQQKFCSLQDEEAVGHIWLLSERLIDNTNFGAEIYPVVWVKNTETLCCETACGSGTLATAVALSKVASCTKFKIKQPSGFYLDVSINKDRESWKISVGGKVQRVAYGQTEIPDLYFHTEEFL